MPIRLSLKERFNRWLFGSKRSTEAYPDLEASPCQKCKIMINYMKLTEKALKLTPISLGEPAPSPEQKDISESPSWRYQ